MKTLLILIVSLYGAASFASSDVLPQAVCPAVTEEATEILSRIQSLKDDINKDLPQCKSMEEKLTSIADVMGHKEWSDVKAALAGDQTVELEGETVDKISEDVYSVAQSLTETVSMLSGSGAACVDESNKTSFLGKLSGVVRGVSSIAGQTSGPYGMAINLGGQLLSSVLSGIESMLPSSVYQFKNPEDEQLFMNQFCSFTEVHKDTLDYKYKDERNKELDILDGYLQQKIQSIREKCELCDGVAIAWLANDKADKAVKQLREDLNLVEMGNDRDNEDYSRCGPIHQSFHTENSHLDDLIEILSTYKNPMIPEEHSDYQYLTALVSNVQGMDSYFPTLNECTRPKKEDRDISWAHEFNRYMRDTIVTIKDTIFGQQVRDLKREANKKYVDELGDYTENSLERRKWVIKERIQLAKALKPMMVGNHYLSAGQLEDAREWLHSHFMDKHFPRFMKFLASRNLKELKQINTALRKHNRSKKKTAKLDSRVQSSQLGRILNKLEKNFTYTYTFSRYCEYVRYLELTDAKIESHCVKSSEKIQAAYDKISGAFATDAEDDPVTASFGRAHLWVPPTDLTYNKSRVAEYSDKLADWNERGDERWCEKSDESPLCEEKKKEKREKNCREAGICIGDQG